MISTLRTYRTLPALLATLMVLSMGLPVLCQVCAPAEAAAADHTSMHAAHQAGHDAPMPCLHGHDEAPAPSDAPHSTSGCDDVGCTTVAEEPAPAVLQTERMVLAVHDASPLAAQTATRTVAAPSPPAHGLAERWASPQIHIPIRLQTASFLL
jgi:hypothetical protein